MKVEEVAEVVEEVEVEEVNTEEWDFEHMPPLVPIAELQLVVVLMDKGDCLLEEVLTGWPHMLQELLWEQEPQWTLIDDVEDMSVWESASFVTKVAILLTAALSIMALHTTALSVVSS